jgi:hypothetical protein
MRVQQFITKKDSGTVRDELSLTGFDLWALGITIVIGGQYFGWNEGLAMGFGSFLIAFFLVAFAFMVLSFSLAELSGVVPFGGKNDLLLFISHLNFSHFRRVLCLRPFVSWKLHWISCRKFRSLWIDSLHFSWDSILWRNDDKGFWNR